MDENITLPQAKHLIRILEEINDHFNKDSVMFRFQYCKIINRRNNKDLE